MTKADAKTKSRYQGDQGLRYQQSKRTIPDQAIPWVARLRAEKLAPFIRPGDTILEYGVGLGWNLAALNCARKIGLDVGEFLEPVLRQHGIEFVTDASALGENSFPVVICHHALEHAWHPGEVLTSIHRLLQPGGRLLLFVPYEKERRYWKFNPSEPNHHLHSWNVQTLGNLVSDAGFEVRSAGLAPFGQERFAAVFADRWGLGERGFRAVHWLANSIKDEREVRVLAVKDNPK